MTPENNGNPVENKAVVQEFVAKSLPVTNQTTTKLPPVKPPANQTSNNNGGTSGSEQKK
jgi:hypothetical protein